METKYKFDLRSIWFSVAGTFMICISYLIYAYDPLTITIKYFLVLSPGSILFRLWSAPPYEVLLKLTIFNITNHEAFLSGDDLKLNVSEVGPYVYREILTNENATFNDDGTLTFYPKRVLEFVPEKSVGDPTVDRIISTNIPLIGIQSYLNDAAFYTNMAFASLSKMTGAESFMDVTIDRYLFGYEDKIVSLANQFIPSWIDFDKFGILDRLMAIDNGNKVKIATQPEKLINNIKNMDPFHIVEWNDSEGLPEWENSAKNTTKCLQLSGAFEGTILPSKMPKNKTIKLFRKAFCRPVPLQYVSSSHTKDGFEATVFTISDSFLDTPEDNPDNACFCVKGRCPPKGIAHLSPCYYGIPITVSRPHFLKADPEVFKPFNGLNPSLKLHESHALVHPTLGIPLEGQLRMQINLDVGETRHNYLTKPFNNMHLPLFWLELNSDELPNLAYHIVNWTCHILPVVQVVVIYVLGIVGLSLISVSALLFLFYNTQQKINSRISVGADYTALPNIITIPTQYLSRDFRISK